MVQTGFGLVGKTEIIAFLSDISFSSICDIVFFSGNPAAMSFSVSSMDLVLAEDWTVSRPSFMTPGFAAQRPMSILDFSLQDGPINVMST